MGRQMPWWLAEITRREDDLDRARRSRTAAGVGAIVAVMCALDIVVGVVSHGLTLVTGVLIVALLCTSVAWWLARRGHPTVAGLLIAVVALVVLSVGVLLTDSVGTWPTGVPVTALILVFVLPLRWSPAVLLLSGVWLLLFIPLGRRVTQQSVSSGDLLRDTAIVTLASVAVGIYGALSLAQVERARRLAQTEADRAAELAELDALTGMRNRRAEGVELPALLQHHLERGDVLSVAMFDVDGFKAVNDRWGHDVGDQVLRLVAQIIFAESRRGDAVVRHGGDEILLALAGTDRADATLMCERIRRAVAAHEWSAHGLGDVQVTVSAGVADSTEGSDWPVLVRVADRRLLSAKRAGRNLVVAQG